MRPSHLMCALLSLVACDRSTSGSSAAGSAAASSVVAGSEPAGALAAAGPPTFRRCRDTASVANDARGFDHKRSSLVAIGTPAHSFQDQHAAPGAEVELAVKVSYGDAGKDLEDEPIEFLLDDCTAVSVVATAKSDDDGIARARIKAPASPGAYAVTARVVGDGTTTGATLFALPAGTEIVVFDIDGTLTVDDVEVTRDVLDEHFAHIQDGEYRAVAYDHGAELARTWSDRGFVVVYLTGRPYWLIDHSRAWLRDGDFPAGLVRTTLRHREVVPNVEGVGEFKAEILRGLVDAGYRIAAAHGNAKTDVWAYAQAGIPVDRTYIIGPHAGDGGTVAVQGGWAAVLEVAKNHRVAAQPYIAK